VLCAAIGVAAGVSPKYGLAVALGLGFTVAVFADLTVGVALFTALSFLDVLNVGGAAVSFMKVAGLLLFLSWIARATTEGRRFTARLVAQHPWLVVWSVALVAWSAISAAWAESPGDAVTTAYRYSLDLLLIPIVFSAVRERKQAHIVVAAFIIGAAGSTLYGVVHPVASTAGQAGRLIGGIGDANEQASVLVAAIALSVGLAVTIRRSVGLTLAAMVGAVIALLGLVSTESRGGLLSFGCVLLAGVAFGGRWRRSALLLVVAGVVAVGGYFVAIASTQAVQRVTSADTSGRSDLWTVGWRMFVAHPMLGVGAGNFPVSSIHYLQRPGAITAAVYIVDVPKVAHNIYLEQLADLGVPGLVVLLGIFVTVMSAALKAAHIFERSGDRDLELLSRCLILALVGFISADFFLSNLVSKQLWLVIALCPALLNLATSQARETVV
jgi:O-antigen ligase